MRRYNPKEKDPCKFSKKIVILCIVFIIIYTCAQIYFSYLLEVELSPTLTTSVYAFFGTELAASALIRIFDKDSKKETLEKSEESLHTKASDVIE